MHQRLAIRRMPAQFGLLGLTLLLLAGCMAPKAPAGQGSPGPTPVGPGGGSVQSGGSMQSVKATVKRLSATTPIHLTAVAFAPGGPAFLADGSTLFTSADDTTWTRLIDLGAPIDGLDFVAPELGWAALASGLRSTHDGGRSWQQVAAIAFKRVDFVDGGRGFAADADGRLFTSGDAGKSWSALPNPCGESPAAEPAAPPFSFVTAELGWMLCGGQPGAGQQRKRLYRTTDGGEHWSLLAASQGVPDGTPGLPGSGYVADLSFINPTHGWLSLSRGAVYATTDGGSTWKPVHGLPPGDTYLSVRFANPTGGLVILDSGGTNLIATGDGGVTWQPVYPPLRPQESLPHRAFDRWNWLAFGDALDRSSLLRTDDGGHSWQRVGSLAPDTVFDISFPDPQHGWAITDHFTGTGTVRTLQQSTDGGATWTPVSEAPADPLEYYNSVWFVDASVGFVASQKRLLITLDGGRSLQNVDETSGGGYQFQFTDRLHGWKIQEFQLYATADGGKSWQPIAFSPRAIALQLLPGGVAWVLAGDPAAAQGQPLLYSSRDGGKNWIQYDLGALAVTGLRFAGAQTGFLSGPEGQLYATEDGGQTWTQVH